MDTALTQKFPFILDRNLAKANCTENRVCTSCDTVVLDFELIWLQRVAAEKTPRLWFWQSRVRKQCLYIVPWVYVN